MDKDFGQFMYSASIGGIGTCKERGVYIVLGYVTNIERVLFLLEKAPRYVINGDPNNGYVGECPVCVRSVRRGVGMGDIFIHYRYKVLGKRFFILMCLHNVTMIEQIRYNSIFPPLTLSAGHTNSHTCIAMLTSACNSCLLGSVGCMDAACQGGGGEVRDR